MFQSGKVDWSAAESLAIGTLLTEGFSVRLSGQDLKRHIQSKACCFKKSRQP